MPVFHIFCKFFDKTTKKTSIRTSNVYIKKSFRKECWIIPIGDFVTQLIFFIILESNWILKKSECCYSIALDLDKVDPFQGNKRRQSRHSHT